MSPGAMGGALSRQESDDALGVALVGAFGFGAGLLLGIVFGELLGDVNSDRVKQVVRRLRPPSELDEEGLEVERLQDELLAALESDPATRSLDLGVRALGDGLVELTGTAPDESTRDLAGKLASRISGAEVVVNRVLVEGTDTNGKAAVSR